LEAHKTVACSGLTLATEGMSAAVHRAVLH
jgi:hypothetical protein